MIKTVWANPNCLQLLVSDVLTTKLDLKLREHQIRTCVKKENVYMFVFSASSVHRWGQQAESVELKKKINVWKKFSKTMRNTALDDYVQ